MLCYTQDRHSQQHPLRSLGYSYITYGELRAAESLPHTQSAWLSDYPSFLNMDTKSCTAPKGHAVRGKVFGEKSRSRGVCTWSRSCGSSVTDDRSREETLGHLRARPSTLPWLILYLGPFLNNLPLLTDRLAARRNLWRKAGLSTIFERSSWFLRYLSMFFNEEPWVSSRPSMALLSILFQSIWRRSLEFHIDSFDGTGTFAGGIDPTLPGLPGSL